MQEVRVSDAECGCDGTVESKEVDQLNRISGRRIRTGRLPLDRTQVGSDERGLARRDQVEQRRPGQQGRIQPERMIRNQVIDTRCTEVIATHGAASDAS